MLNAFDQRCVENLKKKTGVDLQTAYKYYDLNDHNYEKTLTALAEEFDLQIADTELNADNSKEDLSLNDYDKEIIKDISIKTGASLKIVLSYYNLNNHDYEKTLADITEKYNFSDDDKQCIERLQIETGVNRRTVISYFIKNSNNYKMALADIKKNIGSMTSSSIDTFDNSKLWEEFERVCIDYIKKDTGVDEETAKKYCEQNDYDYAKTLNAIKNSTGINGAQIGGIEYGNVSNASTIYGMDKFNTPRGHGFAAERANHLYDKLTGKEVHILGDDDALNGADRSVNGINIQSKYCNSGSKCISECFDNGKFRYINKDGSPMQIEVPSDKYDAAVQAMENRIKNGEVSGVTDPQEAKNIVKKGHFTYEQAKNIAKFGTVESLTFDAVNGIIIATNTMGISAAISFATSLWNGEDFNTALKRASYEGIKVGGVTFVTAVLSSQLSRIGLNSALVGGSEAIVSVMGPKASALLVNAFRSGTNIYGAAAMKSAAKLLRGNAITGAVSVVVLSSVDIVNIFQGRISGKQLFKNISNTASAVAGGTVGWVEGATIGATVGTAIPIIGNVVGGVIGGIVGSVAAGSIAGKASNAILSNFIEDDADAMVRIIEEVFKQMCENYLLNQKEAECVVDNLKNHITGKTLKDMFASSNRENFAYNLLISLVENEVEKRNKVTMPNNDQLVIGLRQVLEEISDNLATAS